MVSITAFPRSLLIDEKLSIKVLGLKPNSPITLRASLTEGGKTYDSLAQFKADSTGQVDLDKHPSVGGNYLGTQCMGLFTSMLPSPKVKHGTQLMKKDVTTPFVTELIVYDGFHNIDEFYQSSPIEVLSRTTVERWYMSKNVEAITVRSGNVRGMLFKPKGKGPFPGVVDVFGGVGRMVTYRAALIASHGFASLALPYFGFKDLPISTHKVTMDYFEEAVDWLIEQKYVKSGGIGVIGLSLGGAIALKMTEICGAKIKACVSISGWPFSTPECPMNKYKQRENPTVIRHPENIKVGDGVVHMVNWYPSSLTEDTKDAMTKVEKSECEFLFISGDDDQCFHGSPYAKLATDYLSSKGKSNWTMVNYPGAGHLIEPPYSPLCSVVYIDLFFAVGLYGGSHDEHALAQEDSWRKILEFLHKHVGKTTVAEHFSPSTTSIPMKSKL